MSRQYSAAVQQLVNSDNFSTFYLVRIEREGLDLKYTNAPYDLNIPGLALFESDNGLKAIEPPRLSNVVDRETYKIVFIDNEYNLRSLFEAGLTGARVIVYIGFYNTLSTTLNGAEP